MESPACAKARPPTFESFLADKVLDSVGSRAEQGWSVEVVQGTENIQLSSISTQVHLTDEDSSSEVDG